MSMLWYVDSTGAVKATRVRPGVTDGQKTAVEGPALKEGMQVIIGVADASQPAASTSNARPQSTNPFQPQRGPGAGRGF
jgi:hypothetical protein